MKRQRLTAQIINNATLPKKAGKYHQLILWDSGEKGLGIRINPAGSRTWVLRYRDRAKKQRIVTLGEYGSHEPKLNVVRAREEATRRRSEVLDGGDPAAARRAGKLTFGELCDRFIKDYARPRLRTWKTDQARIDRHLKPALGNMPAVELPRSEVIALHTRIGTKSCGREKGCMNGGEEQCNGHPLEANRNVQLISRIIEWARDAEQIAEDTPNSAAKFKKYRFNEPKKEDRAAKPEEVKALRKQILKVRNPAVRTAFWLYLLLGLRKRELLGLEWSELNLTGKPIVIADRVTLPERSLFIPKSKNKSKRDFTLPLPKTAVTLIRRLENESQWVFPGETKSGHLESVDHQWQGVRRRAKVPGLTIHDLRATVATWSRNRREESETLIARMLNQRPPEGVTQRYLDDIPHKRVRKSFKKHAAQVLEAAGVENVGLLIREADDKRPAEVIPLRVSSG